MEVILFVISTVIIYIIYIKYISFLFDHEYLIPFVNNNCFFLLKYFANVRVTLIISLRQKR